MLKLAETRRFLLDWQPTGAGLRWLAALSWWLVLGWWLRRSLRPALGGAAARDPSHGPPTKPRRPKPRPCPNSSYPRLPYSSAA